ncbi:MAG TPA: pesticidal protein Cry15Aa [Anaerolineae bacterium]|nr:pesticidal protein Cry15Aa [Anaerolineae bacterium]
MPVIKRYPNRKLYDTEAKKYITLDGIAQLIRQGDEVIVIDHTTDEDLTAVTLTQIIFEQEKKKGGFLPQSVLTELVRAGGDTMNTLRRTLTMPLDLFKQVDEEIEKRLNQLVERGELATEEARRLGDKLLSSAAKSEKEAEAAPPPPRERILNVRGIPSRDEVEDLTRQIDTLSARLDTLIQRQATRQPAESTPSDSD